MTCFCYMTRTIVHYVHDRDFESPWLWDVIINREQLYIIRCITVIQCVDKWFSLRPVEYWLEKYSEAWIYKIKPEPRYSNVNAVDFYSSAEMFESVAPQESKLTIRGID